MPRSPQTRSRGQRRRRCGGKAGCLLPPAPASAMGSTRSSAAPSRLGKSGARRSTARDPGALRLRPPRGSAAPVPPPALRGRDLDPASRPRGRATPAEAPEAARPHPRDGAQPDARRWPCAPASALAARSRVCPRVPGATGSRRHVGPGALERSSAAPCGRAGRAHTSRASRASRRPPKAAGCWVVPRCRPHWPSRSASRRS
mmetsp:Transcript_86681/g.250327  ORF Transcript_86681/g.250327 Transcript_86681/m.250327 type:complete len:202 (+) Transcript_86681:992-1597(+)